MSDRPSFPRFAGGQRTPLSSPQHHSQLSDQTPEPSVSFLRAASRSQCKISSVMSFRKKYLQLLRRQEKETSGDFSPFLLPGLGPCSARVQRGAWGGAGGLCSQRRPCFSPGVPRRQRREVWAFSHLVPPPSWAIPHHTERKDCCSWIFL